MYDYLSVQLFSGPCSSELKDLTRDVYFGLRYLLLVSPVANVVFLSRLHLLLLHEGRSCLLLFSSFLTQRQSNREILFLLSNDVGASNSVIFQCAIKRSIVFGLRCLLPLYFAFSRKNLGYKCALVLMLRGHFVQWTQKDWSMNWARVRFIYW